MKKGLVVLVLMLTLLSVSVHGNILKTIGAAMQLLGLDVPVMDILLTDAEKEWMKKEKKKWDEWKGLYDDFCDVFGGRLRQMIERHTGFSSGKGFDSLIYNTEKILDFVEDSVYYSEYLDRTLLARLRKKDQKKTALKDDGKKEEKEEKKKEQEEELLEFREELLEVEAEQVMKQNHFYGNEEGKLLVDFEISRRSEELAMTRGFLDLITQVKQDEEQRLKEMAKKIEVLEEKSESKPVESDNAEDGEAVTDTSGLLAVMISITQDLYMVNESIHKMVKYHREADIQKFLNERKAMSITGKEGEK